MKIEKNIMAVKCYGSEFLLFDNINIVEKYGYNVKEVKQKLKRKRKNVSEGYHWEILNDSDWQYYKELSEEKSMNNLIKYVK